MAVRGLVFLQAIRQLRRGRAIEKCPARTHAWPAESDEKRLPVRQKYHGDAT